MSKSTGEAKRITFQNLFLQVKENHLEFEKNNFVNIYKNKIDNLFIFWSLYNNIEFESIIRHGYSLFLSLESPIWNPDHGTFSFIITNKSGKNSDDVWADISLFYVQQLLNLKEDNNIKGISLTLKGREKNIFNVKVNASTDDVNFSSLPSYFGSFKFLRNSVRSNQNNWHQTPPMIPPQQFSRPPRHNRRYKNNHSRHCPQTLG